MTPIAWQCDQCPANFEIKKPTQTHTIEELAQWFIDIHNKKHQKETA